MKVLLVRIGIIIAFFLLWELASGRVIDPYFVSSPSRILEDLREGFVEGRLIADVGTTIRGALEAFAADVRERRFPEEQHTYAMPPEELELFEQAAGGRRETDAWI